MVFHEDYEKLKGKKLRMTRVRVPGKEVCLAHVLNPSQACPQSLAPRSLLADMKGGLRKAGIRPPQGVQPKPVQESREYRKVPEERLMARLGLTKYDKDAPLNEELVQVKKVKILLSQHIGAPAQAVVKAGDQVTRGQMIAQPAQGLSVGIHASVSGKATEITDRYIIIAVK